MLWFALKALDSEIDLIYEFLSKPVWFYPKFDFFAFQLEIIEIVSRT